MGIEQTIVTGIALIIVISLFLAFMDYLHPIYLRHQFQEICRAYVFIAEAGNGLSLTEYNNLKSDLEEMGVHVLEMNIAMKGTVKRLSGINFKVKGEVFVTGFRSIFEREPKSFELNYETNQIARRIVP